MAPLCCSIAATVLAGALLIKNWLRDQQTLRCLCRHGGAKSTYLLWHFFGYFGAKNYVLITNHLQSFLNQALNAIKVYCLWRKLILWYNVASWMFLNIFKVKCPASGITSVFSFIWNWWTWIWQQFIRLAIVSILIFGRGTSGKWC